MPTDVSTLNWSDEQRAAVEADPSGYLLVDAPPGTGKTTVACGRVAWLINQGIEPASLLLVSFTRTAVAELRDRIGQLAGSMESASWVRITTLDAEAWALRYGFGDDEVEKLFGGYDANIETVIAMLQQRSDDIVEYFEQFEHLIVDEAQDLNGVRAKLVMELLNVLPDRCGATIFADPAQAIFGFAAGDRDLAKGAQAKDALLDLCAKTNGLSIGKRGLSRIYRTESRSLLSLFLDVRADLLGSHPDPEEAYEDVREAIRDGADGKTGYIEKAGLEGRDGALVLFRRRVEVLMASSLLSKEGVQHRIRMSGVPVCIQAWVGAVLSRIPTEDLNRTSFDEAWSEVAGSPLLRGLDPSVCWGLLAGVASNGRGGVHGGRLRAALARSRPPSELVSAELGSAGPIIGTIHASKGREAPDVHLMLPISNGNGEGTDWLEEARVLYVGATRARDRLFVGNGYKFPAGSLDSGRVYKRGRPQTGKYTVQVEFGRDGDLEADWAVSSRGEVTPQQADALQTLLTRSGNRDFPLTAKVNFGGSFDYFLYVDSPGMQEPIGRLSEGVKKDIWEASNRTGAYHKVKLKPTFKVKHLRCIGVRTVVLSSDDPRVEDLWEPYCSSGVFLAPIIKGFTQIYLEKA